MRVLLAIVVLAALGWGGFWYWNASMREDALTGWLGERRAAGWVAEGEVRVTGFPNRVDSIVTGLDLANPGEGWSWSAPEFQILSQTWKPHQVIAVWPDTQTVATPFDTVGIASTRMIGSAVFEPTLRLGLDRSTVELRDVTLTGGTGWQAALREALLSVRASPDPAAEPHSYDLDFNATDLKLPEAWISGIRRTGVLPETIGVGHLAASLTFDRPWDRPAIEGEPPALRAMRIDEARLAWGRLDLTGSGTLGVDARGYADGRLDLNANNWRAMLDLARRSGAISQTTASTVEGALTVYAALSGSRGDNLKVPLDFSDGRMRLGPVPIGQAPRLGRGG